MHAVVARSWRSRCAIAPASLAGGVDHVRGRAHISAELIVEWTAYGNALTREGSRSPWAAPQGVYATDTRNGGWCSPSRPHDQCRRWSTRWSPEWPPILRWPRTRAGALPTTCSTRSSAPGRRHRPGQGDRPVRRAGIPAAPAFDARRASSTRSSSPALLRGPRPPVIGVRAIPRLPFRYASVDRWLASPRRARPAQPRDPHRPRPLRGRDRRPRSRRSNRHDPLGL